MTGIPPVVLDRSSAAPLSAQLADALRAAAAAGALRPGDRLPSRVPGHAECSVQRGPYFDENRDGDEVMTVFFSECPGVDLTVERVIRLNQNQLLWIQIRADDSPTARRVLDSVRASGFGF